MATTPEGSVGAPAAGASALTPRLLRLCARVSAAAFRLSLDTGDVAATAPMLRGVWGAALHDLDPAAYEAVFTGAGAPHQRLPVYVLRPAAPGPADAPAIEWIIIGPALRHRRVLERAWDVAAGMGLGPKRRRFVVRRVQVLGPAGTASEGAAGLWTDGPVAWPLDRAAWPLPGDPATTPCRLRFAAPLRIIRDGRLIARPTVADLAQTMAVRLRRFAAADGAEAPAEEVEDRALRDAARRVPASAWRGERLDLVRYSGSQRRELDLAGVAGALELPAGPGELWPLFAAMRWLHVGKSTVVGLGRIIIEAREK